MFIFFVIAVIGLGLYSVSGNKTRIKDYIESKGGELVEEDWQPFGKGWFGEDKESIYKIKYYDKKGNLHESWAKTSFFTGVFLSDDTIVEYSGKKDREEHNLEKENQELREEIARLRKELGIEEEFKLKAETEKTEHEKKLEAEHIYKPNPKIPTQIFDTKQGQIIIELAGKDIEVGDKVFLNRKLPPDGRYMLGFFHYIYVKDGKVS